MKCYFKKTAFSLLETLTALAILSLTTSSVVVIYNRCMDSVADSTVRMQAFDVARENMESILSVGSVSAMTEYGTSDKYPGIQWQKTVEIFYEPITERMWARAICSADYADSKGDTKTIELRHWLANLTKEQLLEVLQNQEKGLTADGQEAPKIDKDLKPIDPETKKPTPQEDDNEVVDPPDPPEDDYENWPIEKIIEMLIERGIL